MSECEPHRVKNAAVSIDGRPIASCNPALIIAEAGVNHNGSLSQALKLVDVAADAGADAVKFQMFSATDLVTAQGSTASYQRAATGTESQRDMLSKLELSAGAFERIKQRCEQRSLLFLATPFGSREVDRLVSLGVKALKIASTDLSNHALLQQVAATGIPIILSTGAATALEIRSAFDHLRSRDAAGRLILLHCVSRYPTPLSSINLRTIGALQREYRIPCGLSDHTTLETVGAWAVAAGACVVEKHFTLDTNTDGPDHAVSLPPGQLRAYIAGIRQVESALGDGRIGMTPEENEVRAVASKSVVSRVDIRKGQMLTSDMLTLKRPGGGIPPTALSRVVGMESCADIPADTTLSWDLVQ